MKDSASILSYSDDTVSPEIAFAQYQQRSEDQSCQVCNQPAVGFHHRAYVCEACKKFFMRHAVPRTNGRNNIRLGLASSPGTDPKLATTSCPLGGKCRVIGPGRGKCAHCRYKKCIEIGMSLMSPKENNSCKISKIPCRVCGGASSGFHFGAITCEGCKGFFRRTILSNIKLECTGNGNCPITPANRNICKSCRLERCFRVGMTKNGSRIGRQPNAIKYFCAKEISQISDSDNKSKDAFSSEDGPVDNNQFNNSQAKQWANLIKNKELNENIFVDIEDEGEKKQKDFSLVAVALAAKATLALMKKDDDDANNSKKIKIDRTQSSSTEMISSSSSSSTGKQLHQHSGITSGINLNNSNLDDHNKGKNASPDNRTGRCSNTSSSALSNGATNTNYYDKSILSNNNNVQKGFGSFESFQSQQSTLNQTKPKQVRDLSYYQMDPSSMDSNNLPISVETCFSSYLDCDIDETYMEMLRLRIPHVIGMLGENQFYDSINDASRFLNDERQFVAKNLLFKKTCTLKADDSIQAVWDAMMFHFETHSRFIVNFVKRLPGFNYLSLDDKRQLVREAMYPIMLMELSKDFEKSQWQDEYNYFDFTLEERKVILQNFPSFKKFTVHLLQSGRIIQRLSLTDIEMTYLCALEIFRAHQKSHCLNDVDSCRYLYLFSLKSLCQHLTYLGKNPQERLVGLNQLSPILEIFNREHHEVITKLRDNMPFLNFPELYIDMFRLTNDDQIKMNEANLSINSNVQPFYKNPQSSFKN